MTDGWRKAFNICVVIFGVAFTIAVTSVFANLFVPDEIFYAPDYYSKYVGVKEFIGFIKAIDTVTCPPKRSPVIMLGWN